MSLKTRFFSLLWSDLRPTEFVVALCSVAAGTVFLRVHFAHPDNVSLYLIALQNVAPLPVWSGGFMAYAACRLATALGFQIRPLRCTISIFGMGLWASVFSAGTILQSAPSGLAILYCIPAAFEIWALAQSLALRKIHA